MSAAKEERERREPDFSEEELQSIRDWFDQAPEVVRRGQAALVMEIAGNS